MSVSPARNVLDSIELASWLISVPVRPSRIFTPFRVCTICAFSMMAMKLDASFVASRTIVVAVPSTLMSLSSARAEKMLDPVDVPGVPTFLPPTDRLPSARTWKPPATLPFSVRQVPAAISTISVFSATSLSCGIEKFLNDGTTVSRPSRSSKSRVGFSTSPSMRFFGIMSRDDALEAWNSAVVCLPVMHSRPPKHDPGPRVRMTCSLLAPSWATSPDFMATSPWTMMKRASHDCPLRRMSCPGWPEPEGPLNSLDLAKCSMSCSIFSFIGFRRETLRAIEAWWLSELLATTVKLNDSRSRAHRTESSVATTEAARGLLYSRASSPNEDPLL